MSGTAGKKWQDDLRVALPDPVPSPEEVLEALKAAAGDDFLDGETRAWDKSAAAAADRPFRQMWVRVKREALRPVVKRLAAFHYPHLVVIGATDLGDTIELPYVFRLFAGGQNTDTMVVVAAVLPKADPWVDSLADLIPGIVMGEREKQEMMGVVVRNIPDGRRMFLPEDFPEGVYPWRRDETGPDALVRPLWSEGRPPAPVPPPPPPPPPPPAAPEPPPAIQETPETPAVPEKPVAPAPAAPAAPQSGEA